MILKIGFDVDFVERLYYLKYFSLGDIIHAIGGLNAFINPILKWLIIAFIIFYLFQLALVLREKDEKDYNTEVLKFMTYSKEQIV